MNALYEPRVTTIRDRGTGPGSWTIADSNHRDLGRITEARGFGFFVFAPRGSRLSGVGFGPYETLAEAMQQIAAHTKATCVFSSMPTG
jgi:hypothetical protein